MILSRDLFFFIAASISLLLLNPIVTICMIALVWILCFQGIKSEEIGISLLFFGVSVLGFIGLKIGVPSLGKLSGLVGLFLLRGSFNPLGRQIPLFFTLVSIFILCLTFYFTGPMTDFSFEKLYDVFYYSVIYVVLFNAIFFYGKRVDYLRFSQLSICFVLLYITYAVSTDLSEQRDLVLNMAGFRTAIDHWTVQNVIYTKDGFAESVSTVSYQLVGNFSALSLIFLLTLLLCTSDPACSLKKNKMLIALHVILILLSGARQSIILVILSVSALWFCVSGKQRKVIQIFSAMLIVLTFLAVILGVLLEVRAVMNIFEAEGGLTAVINRQQNIDAAFELIEQKPILGFGFGGYHIPEFGFKPGEVRYFPHNILLELMSEMGIIGTVVFLSIWLAHYLFLYRSNRITLTKSQLYKGYFVLPIFVFYLTSSLMNEILVRSIALFILVSFMLQRNSKI